jgi:hypothetical protein
MIEYVDYVGRLSDTKLAAELLPIRTLERLFGWLTIRGIDLAKLDLIQQDEFSFDLIVPLDAIRWMSFGMS